MRTVAVMSRKGGTGKTTLAVNLALAAHRRGLSTILADIDPQRSAIDTFRARDRDGPDFVESNGGKLFQLKISCARVRCDLLVIDTPCWPETEIVQAANVADLCVLVTRPNFLDVAAAARCAEMIRRVGKPAFAVLNQAPSPRMGLENPAVMKACEALRLTGIPIAPVAVRARTAFQMSIARGLSVEEWNPLSAAAQEIEQLWLQVERMVPAIPAAKRA